MSSFPSAAPEELHELLRPYAVTDDNGAVPVEGNYLLHLWNAAPEKAAKVFQNHFEVTRSSSLGPRLTELVRLSVANSTGCPV